jgi:RNA-directed DNA polymerase
MLMEFVEKRVCDRSVLKLIRMWLKCPVSEEDNNDFPKMKWERKAHRKQAEVEAKNGKRTVKLTASTCGTPQGGVISPLLANIFLNELDKAFYTRTDSPKNFANARLIRYADDFVVQARYMGKRITSWIEQVVEGELKLSVNREKTKVVKLRQGDNLNFLGFTMRYDKDRHCRDRKYLNTFPSKKTEAQQRENLRGVINSGYKHTFKDTIAVVNQKNRGWKNYFKDEDSRKSFRNMNWFVLKRFESFINHRSQRRCKPLRDGESLYAGLRRYGYEPL